MPENGTLGSVAFGGNGFRVILVEVDTGKKLTDHAATVFALVRSLTALAQRPDRAVS